MKRSVFNTPIITPFLRILAGLFLKLTGWKVVSKHLPSPPIILIGAPHTSNWDFILMLAGVLQLRLNVHWMGKNSLFKPGFSTFMQWLGGIPINREAANDVVSQMVKQFDQNPEMILVMAPEGTRSKVQRWRTGFYYIALKAAVPVAMVGIDAGKKELRLLGSIQPKLNIETELPKIQAKFSAIKGINPDLQ